MAAPIQKIHLIFKTHLDVGFTDFAANVVSSYFNLYIPKAIQLAESLRESNSPDRFVWTTGAWLIYEYLEQADAEGRKRMENAIQNGDIAWHALPFTVHSEAMDVALFHFGLGLSQELDRRFSKQTIAAKMTDVPGHTRGIVPLLAEAGVGFLHIGVNAASTPPNVPPVFVWRDLPSGADVIVMYHKGSYGDLMIVPGLDEAIAFAHTGDNLGPQSAENLHDTYASMRDRFPGVVLCASTMDAFARKLLTIKDQLPVVTAELGDTWIHGIGSDPKKVAQFRAMLRFRRTLLDSGVDPDSLSRFSRKLLMIPEHTWGLDVKTHLHDWTNYSAADFQAARSGENYKKMEASWQEQRDYLLQAVESLPAELKPQAGEELRAVEPSEPDTSGYEEIRSFEGINVISPFFTAEALGHRVPDGFYFDGINKLRYKRTPIGHYFGRFWYAAHSSDEYAFFHEHYNVNNDLTREWAVPDFTKPGFHSDGHRFTPFLTWAGRRSESSSESLLLRMEMPKKSWLDYGAPRVLWQTITFSNLQPEIYFDLQWFQKPASRLPESLWFSFNPLTRAPRSWKIEKLGEWISPWEIIKNGNRHLQAAGSGVRYQGSKFNLYFESLDAPLVTIGQANPLLFNNQPPSILDGLHFNLFNNLWGTNFRMWYEDDARFRFKVRVEDV